MRGIKREGSREERERERGGGEGARALGVGTNMKDTSHDQHLPHYNVHRQLRQHSPNRTQLFGVRERTLQ